LKSKSKVGNINYSKVNRFDQRHHIKLEACIRQAAKGNVLRGCQNIVRLDFNCLHNRFLQCRQNVFAFRWQKKTLQKIGCKFYLLYPPKTFYRNTAYVSDISHQLATLKLKMFIIYCVFIMCFDRIYSEIDKLEFVKSDIFFRNF